MVRSHSPEADLDDDERGALDAALDEGIAAADAGDDSEAADVIAALGGLMTRAIAVGSTVDGVVDDGAMEELDPTSARRAWPPATAGSRDALPIAGHPSGTGAPGARGLRLTVRRQGPGTPTGLVRAGPPCSACRNGYV